MHIQAKKFIKFISEILPQYFQNTKALDVGSGDINGNAGFVFDNSVEYHGNDVCEAPNVTIVCRTKDLPFPDSYFDVICSSECFEHDPDFEESCQKILNMLRPGGLFFFTCASTGRLEHGTINSKPHKSYGTIHKIEDMMTHYKNITIEDLDKAIGGVNKHFKTWRSYYNNISKDLYFVGIKNGGTTKYKLIEYTDIGVTETTNNIVKSN